MEYITKENITLLLAILGCCGYVFDWMYHFFTNRKNIDIKIVGHRFSDFDSQSLLLYVSFTNKSRLAISITGFHILIDGVAYPGQEIPITTFEETTRCKGEVISHHEYKSLPFPISISALSGTSGYVYFEFPEAEVQSDSTHQIFQVSTNRGRIIEKKLLLGHVLD